MKYKRPSGTEIEVGDTKANREYAESQGWVEVKAKGRPKADKKEVSSDE